MLKQADLKQWLVIATEKQLVIYAELTEKQPVIYVPFFITEKLVIYVELITIETQLGIHAELTEKQPVLFV